MERDLSGRLCSVGSARLLSTQVGSFCSRWLFPGSHFVARRTRALPIRTSGADGVPSLGFLAGWVNGPSPDRSNAEPGRSGSTFLLRDEATGATVPCRVALTALAARLRDRVFTGRTARGVGGGGFVTGFVTGVARLAGTGRTCSDKP
jgi:hypothetical protein